MNRMRDWFGLPGIASSPNGVLLPSLGQAAIGPMIRVLDDLILDRRTPMTEIYAYADFCVECFKDSPHAQQIRAEFARMREGAAERRAGASARCA